MSDLGIDLGTAIGWREHKRLVGGEILSEKSLEVSLLLEVGEKIIHFYLPDECLVSWNGEEKRWGNLKKELEQTPPFSLNSNAVIPVRVLSYPYGVWKCDPTEIKIAIWALGDKIYRRNQQIKNLREQLLDLKK